jgi:hypothetical protein
VKRYLAVLIVAAAVAGGSYTALRAIHDRQNRTADLGNVERVMFYQLDGTWQPSFALMNDNQLIKIVTTVQMTPPILPASSVRWGIKLDVIVDGVSTWQRQVHFESRQSRSLPLSRPALATETPDNNAPIHRAVTSLDEREFSDVREQWVTIPASAPGAVLRTTLLSDRPAVTAGIRLFSAELRDDKQREQAASDIPLPALDKIIRNTGQLAREAMSSQDIDRSLRLRWRRMSALGDHDSDYATIRLILSAFRTEPPAPQDTSELIKVDKNHWIAVNLLGPGIVHPTVQDPALNYQLLCAATAANSTQAEVVAPFPIQLNRQGELVIPPGVCTLFVGTSSAAAIELRLDGAASLMFPVRESSSVDDSALATLNVALLPHVVRIPLERVDSSHTLEIPVLASATSKGIVGRAVRIDGRISLASNDRSALDRYDAKIHLEFFDKAGHVLSTSDVPISAKRALFETESTASGQQDVSEPISFRVLAPATASRFTVSADRTVSLRLFRYIGNEDRIAEPYFSHRSAAFVWRYVELDERIWFPFFSQRYAALAKADMVVSLWAQTRLDRADATDAPSLVATSGDKTKTDAPLFTLEPYGSSQQQRLRDAVPDAQLARTLKEWPAGSVTRLQLEQPRSIAFEARFAARTKLYVRAPKEALGQVLSITIDGAPWLQTIIDSTGAVIDTPNVAIGNHEIMIHAPTATSVWIDRPPVPDARGNSLGVAKIRTVYALSSTPVRVRVVRKTNTSVRVYAIVYSSSMEADPNVKLRITISGGNPLRSGNTVVRHLTLGNRVIALPAAARDNQGVLIDSDGKQVGYPRVIGLGLLDDLQIGTHEVDVYAPPSANLWVRFVTTSAPTAAATSTVVWKSNVTSALDND